MRMSQIPRAATGMRAETGRSSTWLRKIKRRLLRKFWLGPSLIVAGFMIAVNVYPHRADVDLGADEGSQSHRIESRAVLGIPVPLASLNPTSGTWDLHAS